MEEHHRLGFGGINFDFPGGSVLNKGVKASLKFVGDFGRHPPFDCYCGVICEQKEHTALAKGRNVGCVDAVKQRTKQASLRHSCWYWEGVRQIAIQRYLERPLLKVASDDFDKVGWKVEVTKLIYKPIVPNIVKRLLDV